jgi:hypothetical protein
MAKFEAKIRLKKIEIVIPFENEDDLNQKLNDLSTEKIVKTLEDKFGNIISKEIRQPKPGLESVYRFTPDGLVELIRVPSNEPKTVALVLYAYHPESATIEQVSKSSGVKSVSAKYLSHISYRDYFERRSDGTYALSQKGLTWVTTKIIPELLSEPENSKGV